MLKIYWHHDRFRIWQVKSLLEDSGIQCFIKNEFAIGGVGELSPLDSLPEVWLVDDEWAEKAKQLIAQLDTKPNDSGPWRCGQCNEVNDANFEICWQCETPNS